MVWFGLMVLNATFNNTSVLLWRSVLLVDKTGENHRPLIDKLYHINREHLAWVGFYLQNVNGDRH